MDKEITINGIMSFEIDNVIKTINNYTRKCEINDYTISLGECEYPKDKIKILALTYKLVDWYTSNYEEIQNNKYLYNKREHYQSIDVLIQLLELLLK
jgi:hypothetical protein